MYAAAATDSGIGIPPDVLTFSDLPGELILNYCYGEISGSIAIIKDEFYTYTVDIGGGISATLQPILDFWVLTILNDGLVVCEYQSLCLVGPYTAVSGGSECCGVSIQDEFPDILYLTYDTWPPITLTRVSLCLWTGEGIGPDLAPFTAAVEWLDDAVTWMAFISTVFTTFKDPPLDGPVGSYSVGTYTVTE